jgi:hypothetical protein
MERARLDRESRERVAAMRGARGNRPAGTEEGTTADLRAIAFEENRLRTDPPVVKLAEEYNRVRGSIEKLQAAYDNKDPSTRGPTIGANLQLTLGALTQGDVSTFITSSQPGFANVIERVKKEMGAGSGLISDKTLKEFLNGYKNVVMPWLERRKSEELERVRTTAAGHVMPGVRNRAEQVAKNVSGMFSNEQPAAAPPKPQSAPVAVTKPHPNAVRVKNGNKTGWRLPDGKVVIDGP